MLSRAADKMGKFLLFLPFILAVCMADTPANCTYSEVVGKWVFTIDHSIVGDRNIKCDSNDKGSADVKYNVELFFPDVAIDEFGNKGFWTMIYNQGFEVVVNGRKFFAFSKYEGKGTNATSFCGETMPGWSHDTLGRHWMCFHGEKLNNVPKPKSPKVNMKLSQYQQQKYIPDKELIHKINSVQYLWRAEEYEEYESMTVADMMRRAGGKVQTPLRSSMPPKVVKETKKNLDTSSLPANFDWRNRSGENFVSPVRDQAACGSCYSFSAMGMVEARIKIATNNRHSPILSPQDIVDCSEYSQGCDGGFPYLIGGKYTEDFGAVLESCNPYTGNQADKCTTKSTCDRIYTTNYQYVGGYYGACNEEAMKLALYNSGPISVSFEVEDDFFSYKKGIYQHTGLKSRFNPFELTNHAVLAVGWGEENGVPYWIVKNSWGAGWGEDGYFRIIRGQDEVAIESIAVETFPIF